MRAPHLLLVGLTGLAACGGDAQPFEPVPALSDAGALDSGFRAEDGAIGDAGRLDAAEGPGVTVTFRVTVPPDTPVVPEVHLVGDFQGWDPADEAFRLTRVRPDRWEGSFRLGPGPIAYKYARGDWARVEKGASGEEVPDRRISLTADVRLEDTVASWADRPPAPSTITGDVRRLDALERTALVYLPPGYDAAPARRYPVLYMLDGQNVFDAQTSFAGEWQADEAAETLIGRGEIEPLIIVALENGGASRIHEYTPWPDDDFDPPGGGGSGHLRRLVEELVPLVERSFRTRTGPGSTAICGASLGGLMAAYAAYAHPEVFGLAAALSPSVWWDDRRLLRFVAATPKPPTRVFYADMGTLESGGIPALRALRDALVADGFSEGADLFVEEVRGAGHDESAWRARFPEILRRLFPPG